MGNPVVHFEILGHDAGALRAFYREVFGWHIGDPMPGAGTADYTLVDPGGEGGIGGGIGERPEGYDGHVTFYIHVPDVAAALDAVERAGGRRMMGPDRVPGGPVIALFRDPDDRVVGLTQLP